MLGVFKPRIGDLPQTNMPNLTFLTAPTHDQIRQIIELYYAEGWMQPGPDNAELVTRIISGSHCFMIARMNDGEIVGMGRGISDRVSDAYIQDVTVKKTYRGQGIGSEIIRKLLERLCADGLTWIGLIAERGSHGFYTPLGFEKMPNATPMLNLQV
jgi:spermidine synthase